MYSNRGKMENNSIWRALFRTGRLQISGAAVAIFARVRSAIPPSTLHSAPGISAANIDQRLDGWANRDLNVGAIVALAPNLQPVVDHFDSRIRT
jgi:hypothetical protein